MLRGHFKMVTQKLPPAVLTVCKIFVINTTSLSGLSVALGPPLTTAQALLDVIGRWLRSFWAQDLWQADLLGLFFLQTTPLAMSDAASHTGGRRVNPAGGLLQHCNSRCSPQRNGWVFSSQQLLAWERIKLITLVITKLITSLITECLCSHGADILAEEPWLSAPRSLGTCLALSQWLEDAGPLHAMALLSPCSGCLPLPRGDLVPWLVNASLRCSDRFAARQTMEGHGTFAARRFLWWEYPQHSAVGSPPHWWSS